MPIEVAAAQGRQPSGLRQSLLAGAARLLRTRFGRASASGQARAGSSEPVELRIHTLGRFQLLAGERDLAPILLNRRVKCHMWLCLLAREALQPGLGFTRSTLGDEAFPGLSAEAQRARIRKRLSELQLGLPAPLADRVRVDGEFVGLDLSDCQFDVAFVQRVARAVTTIGTEPLPDSLVMEAEEAVGKTRGEFLTVWEEIRRRAGGRGAIDDVVAAVRDDLAIVHCRLLMVLADHHRSRRRRDLAIAYLEEALRRRPDVAAIAPRLVRCYREVGDARRAARLIEEYGVDEAS